jgi:putative nucleotidyltransferase-like protein
MPSGAAFETEWCLLLAACSSIPVAEKLEKTRLLLQKPICWPALFERSDRHGVTFLLSQTLSQLEDQMPAREMQRLEQRYRTNLHKTLLLARELIRILDCLEALAVEVMPYKGVVLAEAAYGDMALRQSSDIDLLIRTHDFPRIREAIRELGYTPNLPLSPREEQAYLRSGYECAFDSPAGPNLLELQWALQPRFYAVEMDMNGLFQHSVTVTIAGRTMKTLSPEDLLLVLSLHAAKHAWGRLVWLCDIARLMSEPNLNWEWIKQQAGELGIARILNVTLLLANRLLGASIPALADATVAEDPMALTIADEVAAGIASGAERDVESLSYFRLMLRLRERRVDQVRFLSRLLFTPGPSEWKAVHLPPVLFPLYRVVRLSRLAARVARA